MKKPSCILESLDGPSVRSPGSFEQVRPARSVGLLRPGEYLPPTDGRRREDHDFVGTGELIFHGPDVELIDTTPHCDEGNVLVPLVDVRSVRVTCDPAHWINEGQGK